MTGGGLTHLWDKIKSYLTTWKTSNFGTGTYYNYGTINQEGLLTVGTSGRLEVGSGFTLYSGLCNNPQGVYAISHRISTVHGIAYICGNASTYAKSIVNDSTRKILVTSIPIPANSNTQFDTVVSQAMVVEVEAGASSAITPTGNYQGALIIW